MKKTVKLFICMALFVPVLLNAQTWNYFNTSYGYINLGPANSTWAHIYTDRPAFLFNKNITLYNTGTFRAYNSDLKLQAHSLVGLTILKSNANVGIGTTMPDAKLHINTGSLGKALNLQASTVSTIQYGFYLDNGQAGLGAMLGIKSSNQTEYSMVFNSTNEIGIGTVEPKTYLHIETPDGSSHGLALSQGGSLLYSGRLFFENTTETNKTFCIHKIGDRLSFKANATLGSNSGIEIMSLTYDNLDNTVLTLKGKLLTEEVDVRLLSANDVHINLDGFADFVFEDNYILKPLKEVEEYINENKHLPDVPSEAEVIENGVNLGEMDKILLQKIEELTLYMIEQNKIIEGQNSRIKELESKL